MASKAKSGNSFVETIKTIVYALLIGETVMLALRWSNMP